jgi:hypothetical protein
MIIALLILHGLLAVALLGAITHQAIGVMWPGRGEAASFLGRVRTVSTYSYVNAIVVLYVVTALLGGIIYPTYRMSVRFVLEQMDFFAANGSFELKEHFVAVGLGLLPVYWYLWRQPLAEAYARARATITGILAFTVWWSFLVGHILNNIRGLE